MANTERVVVTLTKEEKKAVDSEAARRGDASSASVIREALRYWLSRERKVFIKSTVLKGRPKS